MTLPSSSSSSSSLRRGPLPQLRRRHLGSSQFSSHHHQFRQNRRYARSTLLRILFAMLGVIFLLYAALMVVIARRTHAYNLQSLPNGLQAHTTTDRIHPKKPILEEKPRVLKAYIEHVDQESWKIKPLPRRTPGKLRVIEYPKVTSCSKLPEQWPVDPEEAPDLQDPFLPWIHDVFPTHDGRFIQFVAQNRRRCDTGQKNATHTKWLKFRQPQAAIFQHVPVQRIEENGEPRYRLSSHEDADVDGVATRFICRFQPSGEETLSVFNFNYDYASYRKANKHTFTEEGKWDIKSLHTTQLIFQCPVPPSLQPIVRSGESVRDDGRATLHVDLIPIRTPPRFGPPEAFLPPRYEEFVDPAVEFNTTLEWGDDHILPRVEESGRWENIPICKPTLMTYGTEEEKAQLEEKHSPNSPPPKSHHLVACLWASASYATRGERFAINDGQRRLREWLQFQWLVGFDHVYLYDNTLAHTDTTSLQSIADEFPDRVTRIVWPAKVCNNRKNNVDSPGERSSQYAAESSCRLRFGPHVNWIGQFDIDEYLVPVAKYNSLLPLLDKLEGEGKRIVSFNSWRAWPRKTLIEPPVHINNHTICSQFDTCFVLKVPEENTILQSYNCDRQKGEKKETMPAEKQLYKPDYVRQHFIHYSTITHLTTLNREETIAFGQPWRRKISADPLSRFASETEEGTMLHTKAIATQDTAGWLKACRTDSRGTCRIGNPYPPGAFEQGIHGDAEGWEYNCFVNEKIENYWVPKLEQAMGLKGKEE